MGQHGFDRPGRGQFGQHLLSQKVKVSLILGGQDILHRKKAMLDGILRHGGLALSRRRPRGFLSIFPIGIDLSFS